jgi:hypothetical protein
MPDTPSTQAMNLFELYGDLPHKNPNFEAQENLKAIYKPNGIYGSQLDQIQDLMEDEEEEEDEDE